MLMLASSSYKYSNTRMRRMKYTPYEIYACAAAVATFMRMPKAQRAGSSKMAENYELRVTMPSSDCVADILAGAGASGSCLNASESCGEIPPLPIEHMPDMCGFLPELASQLATAQTTQDVEVEQKHQDLLQLKV